MWGDLLHSVLTGEDAIQHRYGVGIRAWRADRPQETTIYARAAMGPDGTLLVIEGMIGPPNEGQRAAFSDLMMLVGTRGRDGG